MTLTENSKRTWIKEMKANEWTKCCSSKSAYVNAHQLLTWGLPETAQF